MEASTRPWFTTGNALVGASAIVMAPTTPVPPSLLAAEVRTTTTVVSSEFHLTAFELLYILTLPVVRQQIRNCAENWAVDLYGFAKSGRSRLGVSMQCEPLGGTASQGLARVARRNGK